MVSKEQQAFLSLVRIGLWENESVQDSGFKVPDSMDWDNVLQLADEQSVVGLVATGINLVNRERAKMDGSPLVRKNVALKFIGRMIQLENRNTDMNSFLAALVAKMRKAGIETLLVKGQGVAQCYDRPLRRASGDVDFLLDEENYKKAKVFLLPFSSSNKREERYSKHLGIEIDSWYIELHGTLRTGLSGRVDLVVDAVLDDVFRNGRVRIWMNDDTRVLLPAPNHDVFLVFTHFIKHFYKKGLALRQICDWVRLLWTYSKEIDVPLLESWVKRAGLMKEWQAFGSLAVDCLGMPKEAMPFYDSRSGGKGEQLIEFALGGYSENKVKDTLRIAKIFPWKALCYSPSIFWKVNWLKVKERMF